MDAHALLTSQGWRGKGHSLHTTDDAIGLAMPLLLSKKDDTKGLGTKQHFTSDQWWMHAFDEQLKGLDTSQDGKVLQTVTAGKLNSIEKGSQGKYALGTSFVRGGYLEGTMTKQEGKELSNDSGEDKEAAKSDEPQPRKETKEERRARKEAKRRRKEERAKFKAARLEVKTKASNSGSSEEADYGERRRRVREAQKRWKRRQKETIDGS